MPHSPFAWMAACRDLPRPTATTLPSAAFRTRWKKGALLRISGKETKTIWLPRRKTRSRRCGSPVPPGGKASARCSDTFMLSSVISAVPL